MYLLHVFVVLFLCFHFWPCPRGMWNSCSLTRNQTYASLHWKGRVLTTGPPVVLFFFFFKFIKVVYVLRKLLFSNIRCRLLPILFVLCCFVYFLLPLFHTFIIAYTLQNHLVCSKKILKGLYFESLQKLGENWHLHDTKCPIKKHSISSHF